MPPRTGQFPRNVAAHRTPLAPKEALHSTPLCAPTGRLKTQIYNILLMVGQTAPYAGMSHSRHPLPW
jgi:hypothetical protein